MNACAVWSRCATKTSIRFFKSSGSFRLVAGIAASYTCGSNKVLLRQDICQGRYFRLGRLRVIQVNAPLLALTPISAFRPRRWRGAVLPQNAKVTITVLDPDKRPVASVADHVEVRHVKSVDIAEDKKRSMKLLFDPGHSLAERVLNEQFKF